MLPQTKTNEVKMKTQIKELINGAAWVKRDLTAAKYAGAPKSTSAGDYAGTNYQKRLEIADKVFAENGEFMEIEILGQRLTLKRGQSCSGKTKWYSCDLTAEQVGAISPRTFSYESAANFVLNGDCTALINYYTRRSPRAQWKHRGWQWIGEEFITIL